MAPDTQQHHVINHLTGDPTRETRNVLVESARIARGAVKPVSDVDPETRAGLVLPGGFGAAKNLSSWAFDGPGAKVDTSVRSLIEAIIRDRKPVAALCVSPVVVARVLQDLGVSARMTLGTTSGPSPYDIAAFDAGLKETGAVPVDCPLGNIVVDEEHRISTSPCYMMEATPSRILAGVRKACAELVRLAGV